MPRHCLSSLTPKKMCRPALSIEWHIGVDHGVGGGRNKLMEKLKELNIEPFEIKTEEEVKELKRIYKGHFKAFKNGK